SSAGGLRVGPPPAHFQPFPLLSLPSSLRPWFIRAAPICKTDASPAGSSPLAVITPDPSRVATSGAQLQKIADACALKKADEKKAGGRTGSAPNSHVDQNSVLSCISLPSNWHRSRGVQS